MNLTKFHELKLQIEVLRNSKEYADDAIVEGLYNRAELLIKRMPNAGFLDNIIRMFNETRIRNRPFNNNQKLLALENLMDNLIHTVEYAKLSQNQEIKSAYRIAQQGKQSTFSQFFGYPFVKWVGGILTALLVAYIISRLGWN